MTMRKMLDQAFATLVDMHRRQARRIRGLEDEIQWLELRLHALEKSREN